MSIAAGLAALMLVSFDIPAGDADPCIKAWSATAHVSVLYIYPTVVGVQTRSVHGLMEPMEALRIMLQGTDLGFDLSTPEAVAVYELADHYCHPERGAAAPLPPCMQKPLLIGGSRL